MQFFNHCFIFEHLQSFWLFFITVYLYKCWVSRTDCSTCHYDSAAEPYLKCGWCKAVTNKCVVQEACIEEGGRWFPYTSNCDTKPNITKVFDCECPLCSILAASLVPPFTHFLALSLVPPLVFVFWLPPWCSLVLIFWLPPWCYTFYYLPAWHIWNKVVWLYSQTGTLGTVISPVKSILWCWYLKLKSCLPWGGHAGWTYDLMCSNNILGLASCWSYTWWNRSWNSRFWSWKIISWYCQYCFSSRLSMFC